MLVRLIFNCTGFDFTQFLWNRDYKKKRKENGLKLLWYKTHFLFPQFQFIISELLKSWRKTIRFQTECFFSPRNNQTQEILYSIFFCQSWGPTCCFCGCDSFDEWEKRLGYRIFQRCSDSQLCSGLGFPLPSYNKSQNNTSTIQLLKQRLKDRKCGVDLKTFL